MNQVKNLDFEYIVAIDLAARGLIEGVSHVINDAIPQDFLVHRVGRTDVRSLPGTAITLYQPSDDSDNSRIGEIRSSLPESRQRWRIPRYL